VETQAITTIILNIRKIVTASTDTREALMEGQRRMALEKDNPPWWKHQWKMMMMMMKIPKTYLTFHFFIN
jgi:hypothetical protein